MSANRREDPVPKDPCAAAGRLMTCQDCTEFLMDYIDGTLPEGQRAKFELHLRDCPDCVTFLENYRKAVALAERDGREDRVKLSADAPQALIEAILASRKNAR